MTLKNERGKREEGPIRFDSILTLVIFQARTEGESFFAEKGKQEVIEKEYAE